MLRISRQRAEQTITGFQSPADDYLEGRLNIAEILVIDPHCTFYFQMDSHGMRSYGIRQGDLLIIDRSLIPVHGAIVVAFADDTFYCRYYDKSGLQPCLKGDTDVIKTTDGNVLQIWGVVTSICRNTLPEQLRKGRYNNVCTL
jgi:DNA polymerase V